MLTAYLTHIKNNIAEFAKAAGLCDSRYLYNEKIDNQELDELANSNMFEYYFGDISKKGSAFVARIKPLIIRNWHNNIDAILTIVKSFQPPKLDAGLYQDCVATLKRFVNSRDFNAEGRYVKTSWLRGAFEYVNQSADLRRLNANLDAISAATHSPKESDTQSSLIFNLFEKLRGCNVKAAIIFLFITEVTTSKTLIDQRIRISADSKQVDFTTADCFLYQHLNSTEFHNITISKWQAQSLVSTSPLCERWYGADAIRNFLASQSSMCLRIPDSHNYGGITHNLNTLIRLKQIGYSETTTVVHNNEEPALFKNKEKIYEVLNLPYDNRNPTFIKTLNVTMVSKSQFKDTFQSQDTAPALLFNCAYENHGYLGGLHENIGGSLLGGGLKVLNLKGEDTFFAFQQCGTNKIHHITHKDTGTVPYAVKVPTLSDLEDFLNNNGRYAFVKKVYGLPHYLNVIKNQHAVVMTMYGRTLAQDPFRVFNFILAARLMQNRSLSKPFVISILFNINEKAIENILNVINHDSDILTLTVAPPNIPPELEEQFLKIRKDIHSKPVPQQLKNAIKELNLTGNVETIVMEDKKSVKKWDNLQPNKLYLVIFPRLPSLVHNVILINAVLSIIEGANASTLLNNNGSPRLRCPDIHTYLRDNVGGFVSSQTYENLALVESLQMAERIMHLHKHACGNSSNSHPVNPSLYGDPIYKEIADFLIDANDPNSEVVRFFKRSREAIHADTYQDRVSEMVKFAMNLSSRLLKRPQSGEQCLHLDLEESTEQQNGNDDLDNDTQCPATNQAALLARFSICSTEDEPPRVEQVHEDAAPIGFRLVQ